MDPKTLANLDPKLRETYERVMGAAATSGAPAGSSTTASPPPADGAHPDPSDTPPAPSSPAPDTTSESLALAQAAIPTPNPNAAVPAATPSPSVDTAIMTNPPVQPAELAALQPTMTGGYLPNPTETHANPALQPLPSPAAVNQTAATTGISPTLRILYFTAGIIFFIVYAVFWLKIFNYPLPF